MFELLFLVGLFGLMLGAIWEYVTALPAFPTILVASAAIPLLAWADYLQLVQRLELGGMSRRRAPVPPERFYWTLGRSQLSAMLIYSSLLGVAAWVVAIKFPAAIAPTKSAIVGWTAGAIAIVASARFWSSLIAYVRASQWFDKMTPWAVGFCRRSLYRLSDNPDFLAPERPERQEKEKSIY